MTDRSILDQQVDRELYFRSKNLERLFHADVLAYVGELTNGVDQAIRDTLEGFARKPNAKQSKLAFVLETPGGYAETARRISDIIRYHYREVDFIIPSHAMSAGTILALSGDAIHMDYYSVLGPIDPQVPDADGHLVPALGYLIQYERLIKKANDGDLSTAEMQLLLSFDQTRLYAYEQARDLSRSLLEEWLVQYKFKDWTVTASSGRSVTLEMKQHRAKEVADKLNDVRLWNSHGIGISMRRLQDELNLRIDDFGLNGDVQSAIRNYHGLLTDFMARTGHRNVLHTRGGYRPLTFED